MLDLITPFEDLIKEATEIQTFLDESLDESLAHDNPEMVLERGFKLSSYISRTGKMKADARYHLDKNTRLDLIAQIKNIIDYMGNGVSAKVQNTIADSICKDERHLYEWVERLNRTATHQLDWCRSVLSYEKEEMRASNFQRT